MSETDEILFSVMYEHAEIAAGRADTLSTTDGGFAGFVDHAKSKPWIAAVRGSLTNFCQERFDM